jgi:uncharacterized LabA/DUF88 family protein
MKVYAFIDSQNVNLGVKNDIKNNHGKLIHKGFELDFKQFFIYLKDVHRVEKAFLFIGFVPENISLYTFLQEVGFILVFKPTLKQAGIVKGNCDAELVLHSMIEYQNYDKAIIASGDGDFACLVEYLTKNNKLQKVLIPNKHRFSSLLRKYDNYLVFLNQQEKKLKKPKKSA